MQVLAETGIVGGLALLAFAPGQEGKPRTLPVTHCELGRELRRLASDAKLAAWDVIVAGPPCGDGRGYSTLLDFALTVGATGVNRVYDGGANATVTLSDDRVTGDVLTTSYAGASFANKNVGTAKLVSVSGISLAGAEVIV